MLSSTPPPESCPVCGEDVPRNARACPGCGADERTGWNEEATRYDGLDLPADAFGEPPARPQPDRRLLWFAVAILLLAALILPLLSPW